MKNLRLFLAFTGVALLSMTSCTTNDHESSNSAEDQQLLAAATISDFATEVDFQSGMDAAGDDSSLGRGLTGSASAMPTCATVTVSGTGFPKTYTIDFGSGCTSNGVTRSGILIVTLSGYFFENGTVITIQRNNYKVNNYKIAGTVVYTNQTTGSDVPQWLRTISDGEITNPVGVVYTHTGSWTVRQIGGANSLLVLADNVYETFPGTHTVNGPGNSSLTATIVEPLTKSYVCPTISQGVLNLQGSWLDGDLNYGNGTCDNQAVYTHSDGNSYNVTVY